MEEKKEGGNCGTGCGIHCGCCVCKATKGLVLLVIGGAIGFFVGRGCRTNKMCRMEAASSMHAENAAMPDSTPAPKKAK